ncbi:hypothetical protein A2U01_0087564, partial [Trifolium medium]|nr:hypothetical protein [Trifolium medium]
SRFLSVQQHHGFRDQRQLDNLSRRHGSLHHHEQRSDLEMSRREQGQYDVARKIKDGVAFRCRPRVGRSRVRRAVENDNSGCVG